MRIFHPRLCRKGFLYVDLSTYSIHTYMFLFLGKRTFQNTLSKNVDTRIQGYIDEFKKLKEVFNGRAVLQTEITVSRIWGAVDSLGEHLRLFVNSQLT